MLHKIFTPMALAALAFVAVIAAGILAMTPAKADGWTGCYVGVAGGYASALTNTSVTFGALSANVDSLGAQGGSVTGLLGCDMQVAPRIILGVWGDYSKTNADFSVNFSPVPAALISTGLDTSWALGARAGYIVVPNTMAYVLIGYGEADTKNISFPAFALAPPLSVPTLSGVVLGAGVEVALGGGWYGQTQYKYTNYDSVSIPLGPGVGAPVLGLDTDVQEVRLGLLFKFNTGDAANAFSPAPLK